MIKALVSLPGMCGEEGGQVGRGTSGPPAVPPLKATVCVHTHVCMVAVHVDVQIGKKS